MGSTRHSPPAGNEGCTRSLQDGCRFRIEIILDLADFDRSVDETVYGYVMATLADALNEIADTVVERLVDAQAAQLARPKNFTQRSN
ncbi:hypothetical protein [Methylorubrum zatmanii]|uniref:Uncharacterized protein n=1 Tax=Methylorubrum zatmanii TaxID=29429 RepID=A0ABW1WMS2_9HYPH|nr:hypothetical protein [Methylorubrum zatmanii]